jgi:hypothetical protein
MVVIMAPAGGSLGGPDFTITEGGVDILFGNFVSPAVLSGNVSITDNSATVITGIGRLGIGGGNADLIELGRSPLDP